MSESSEQDHGTGAIARRAGVVVGGTLASRLMGALRDAVIAATFAVGATDAFFVAWTIPNTLRSLFAEGAASAAFVPTFAGLREREGNAAARRYYSHFSGAMLVIVASVTLLGVLTAPQWAAVYGAGYQRDPERFATLVHLTRILFPYIMFAGFSALGMGALNALGYFAIPAAAPAMLNVSIIVVSLWMLPWSRDLGLDDITALAIAALLGGLLQCAVQIPNLVQLRMFPLPVPRFTDPAVRRSLGLMVPLLLGTGVYQANILLSRLLASFLVEGSQSYLYYGQRVVEIPQGMFAVAIGSAALPSLATLRERGDHERAKRTLSFSIRLSLMFAVPAATAIACLAEPLVSVLFARGEFGSHETHQTARSLAVMALSVWAVASAHPIIRMFHAYGDARSPVVCSAVNLLTFGTVSVLLMGRLGHVAIALASSLAAIAQLIALVWLLQRKLGSIHVGEIARSALRYLIASLVMALVILQLAQMGDWKQGGNDPRNLAVFALTFACGVVVYFVLAYKLGSRELRRFVASIRRRRRKVS